MQEPFNRVTSNLLVYLHPEYFLVDFEVDAKKGNSYNHKQTEIYWKKLSSIDIFLKKIKRYELYFNEFYPEIESITNHEALEHHIHAYLEDLQTLRNKISNNYLDALKKDLKQIAINKDEVAEALTWLRGQADKGFNGVNKLRNPHRHNGYKFADPYVTDLQMAHTILASEMKDRLTEYGNNELNQKLKNSFQEGKEWWANNAKDNYNEVMGLTNEVFEKTEDFLYAVLDIQKIDFSKKN